MKLPHLLVASLLLAAPHSLSAAPATGSTPVTTVQSLDGPGWTLATDAKNVGRDEKWFAAPQPTAVPAHVPWVIQDAFPGYHGVAWYCREFTAPVNPHPQGRFLLRLGGGLQGRSMAERQAVGGHEGGETPFTLDVTETLKAGQANALAVGGHIRPMSALTAW